MREAIVMWEEKLKTATGRDAFIIKKTLIDLRKDQYVIKNAYRRPITLTKISHGKNLIMLDGEEWVDEDGNVQSKGVSFCNPEVCSAFLCNYSKLKEDSYSNFESNTWYMIYDFENLVDKALAGNPVYMRLVECKIDGMQNIDI